MVRMDEEGYLYIVDRLKKVINTSGFKVWPREVEEVIYKHPGIKLAAVIGIPDSYRGESVKAFVVPDDESESSIRIEDLMAHCRKYLSAYKVPRVIELRKELPLSSSGKILFRILKEEEAKKIG
jgi:fatty-acyl-CoA synthase